MDKNEKEKFVLPVEIMADRDPQTPSREMKPPDAPPAMLYSHQHLGSHPPEPTFQDLSRK